LTAWGVSPRDLAALKNNGVVRRSLGVESPASGAVIDKMAVQGIYATPDMHLFRIAELSQVWVVASLYETEIALVRPGDPVDIELPAWPGKAIRSSVSYVYPELDVATRTGRARIEIDNADGALKPGMYATVTIAKDLGEV
jgi:Cu(I)/Ag(I) efflux system membrane fusion protein